MSSEFQSFSMDYAISSGFFINSLNHSKEIPFYFCVAEYFYHERVLNFDIGFFC